MHKQRWVASGMLAQWEHMPCKLDEPPDFKIDSNRFDSHQSKYFGTYFAIGSDLLSLAPTYKRLLGDSGF